MWFRIEIEESGEATSWELCDDTLLDIDALTDRFLEEMSGGAWERDSSGGIVPLGCGHITATIYDPKTHGDASAVCWASRSYFLA